MSALHSKATQWIRRGTFDELTSFADLETRINEIPEEKDRGDVFEIFIEGYLATQPITQRVKHWVVGSIPLEMRERYKLPVDATGIDGQRRPIRGLAHRRSRASIKMGEHPSTGLSRATS